MKTTAHFFRQQLLVASILLFGGAGITTVSAQCDTEVSGVFTYCNAVGTPGTTGYFVAFRVFDPTGDTLNVVDLNGNNVTNRGKRIDDINTDSEPATVTIVPLMIAGGADSIEFWYFGPFPNGSSFDIALVDPDNVCDTVFIASGTYDCMDNTGISDPMACDNDVPLYFLDFSQTEFVYGGGGGGNETFDEVFLIMQRSRENFCCDLQPANQSCFEFIVRLGDQDVGLTIDDVGSGSPGGEIYADTLNMFNCTGVSATTWPYTQSGGQSQDLPLCLVGGEGQEFVVLSCKSGGNQTGVSIDALSNIFSPPVVTIEPCNDSILVFNADTVFWSSPDDPNLDNLVSCTGDSTICSFLYNQMVFGDITSCEGDTFFYYVGAFPQENLCFTPDTILYDTTYVVVYPVFSVEIDSMCNATGDSLLLSAVVSSPAVGCAYDYLWSTGDTTQSITVPFDMLEYSVTVTRADIPLEEQQCVVTSDSIIANGSAMIDCSSITDTLYSCISQLPDADTALVTLTGCIPPNPLIFVVDESNGGGGCLNDSLIITRYYIVDFDGDTINTTTDQDTCAQDLIFIDQIPPTITCPANVTVQCANQVPPVNTGGVVSTDNCGGGTTISHGGDVISNMTCTNRFIVTRTYIATDDCGNSATCAQTITVFDNTAPTLTCPANVTVQCASLLPAPNTSSVIVNDNCAGVIFVTVAPDVISNMTCANQFVVSRVYTATDACGNSATCTQTLTVFDNTPPSITCPGNVTVQCAALIPAVNTGAVVATDNCGGIPVVSHVGDVISQQTCTNRFVVTRTYSAIDACGNSATCAQTITVFDDTPPAITCPSNLTFQCASQVPAANIALVTSSDNCGATPTITHVGDVITNMTCINRFTVIRTYRATDDCGNSATCAQSITVFDNTLPVITCPADVTIECGSSTAPANTGTATATDNCGGTPVITFNDSGTTGTCPLAFTRTWIATDACGNSATCNQTITLNDNTPPVITCPANTTIECTASTLPANTGSPTTSDNCDLALTVTFSDVIIPGNCPQEFTINRTWTATDDCLNSSTCLQTIVVDDSTPPVITCPANVTVQCAAQVPPANIEAVTATDACSPATITFLSDVTVNFECVNRFHINRTYRATDLCGNSATCVQTITVFDDTSPTITCPANVTVQCASLVPPVNIAAVVASDNCAGVPSVTHIGDVVSNMTCTDRFILTRTYRATDACGNSATCAQTITVFDNTPPTITCPANVTVACASNVPPANINLPTSDNCGGTVTVTNSDVIVNMTCANRFTINRTYTATDACGNTATCLQVITVFDNTPPLITCPANVTVQCASQVPAANTASVVTSDNCTGTVTVTVAADVITNMTCANRFTITRVYTATDVCGNSATCAQTITVFDNTPPTITCPANITVTCATDVPAPNPGSVVSSDNCGGAATITHVGDVTSNMTCANSFVVTRTYRATDVCGNSSTCNQTITVSDQVPPAITCPPNVTIDVNDSTLPLNTGSPTASDNCGGTPAITSSDVIIPGECPEEFTIQRTWTATDACSNTATCLQTIVLDGGCLIDLALEKTLNGGQGTIVIGDDITFTITITNEGLSPVGSITITDYIPVGFSLNDPDWTPGNEGSTGQSASIVLSVANGGLPAGGLLPGQSVSVEITLLVGNDVLPGEHINTAEISFVFDLAGTDVSDDDIDSDPDEDDLNDPVVEDDHDMIVFCIQPTPVILGDNFVCPGDTVTYSVAVFNPANTYNWIIQNGGGVIIDDSDSTITIVWQEEPGGAFVIQLTEIANSNCQATTLLLVFIQGDDVLACNDHVNISIDEDCSSVVFSGMILEGELFGDDNYVVIIIDQNGDTIPNATVTAEHVGQTFTVKVMSECSEQSCWGTIFVEDKLPPQITCICPENNPEPDPNCEITCLEVAQLLDGNIPISLQPIVTDNCGDPTLEIIATDLINDNCTGGSITITWLATDNSGNTASCSQEFTIVPLSLDSLEFPENFIGECGGSVDPEITGWPQVNGIDVVDDGGLCNIFAGYWDKELAECGGGRKIVRTWTVLDWCTIEIVESVQVIKLTDTQGPELICPANITVGTDFWYCFANVSVPKPQAHDACSDIESFTLTSSGGDVFPIGNNFIINNLLIGTHTVTWTVADECGNSSTCSFTITVIDNVVPVANCDHHTIVSLTNDGPSGITLVPASVFDDGSYDNCGPVTFRARRMDSCIEIDWTTEGACIDHIAGGVPSVNSRDRGTVHRPCVPFACCDVGNGPIMVELEVTDAAGNVNFCMVEVTVQDKISPLMICPPDIIVSCDFWFAFEEGTFVDAEGNNNGTLDEDPLSEVFGNMFDAFRFDESVRGDIIINDPGNDNISQPHFWGIDGWADDNCEVNLQVRVRLFDDCSGESLPSNAPPGAVRLIERRFSASDGNEGIPPGTCTQRIWVVDFTPFFITDQTCNNNNPNDGVIWPCDIVLTTCPDDLSGTGEPVIFDDACSLIGVSYEDTRFEFVDGACFKILREWIIIDWCQYNPLTGEGLWRYVQVIKVHDHDGPAFLDCPVGPVELCVADPGVRLPANNQAFLGENDPNSTSCSAHVTICHRVTETCSETVRYDVKLYPFNGSEFIQVKPLSTATVDENNEALICFDSEQSPIQSIKRDGIPYNSPWCGNYHRILFSVQDGCGNWNTCSYLIRLVDCKQPSPVCINGLSTVVMPTSGAVTIWAKDFDASSFDDCTASEALLFSFSGDSYQPSFTYTCDNVPAFGVELVEEIWVADGGVDHNCNGQIEWSERNKDFCTTTIVITDNAEVCDTTGSVLAGVILTPHTHAISNVIVKLNSPGTNYPDAITDGEGKYQFDKVTNGLDYTIHVDRNDNHKNGVSTLDLVYIQKHLLGREPFISPYQFIAADANNNGSVSAFDLVELRKLILGIYTDLPHNSSWRFVDKNFVMQDPQHPWPFNDFISIEQLKESIYNNDFVGIKVGDVNNTAKANASQVLPREGRRVLKINASVQQPVDVNDGFEIILTIPEPLLGFQWTMEPSGIEYAGIRSEQISIDEQNVGLLKDGKVTISWNGEIKGETSITLTTSWKGNFSNDIRDMLRFTGSVTEAEAYSVNGEILDIQLVFDGIPASEFALYQNQPNPWKDQTTIGFTLSSGSDVVLTVYDVTGKVVRVIEGKFSAGYNTINLSEKDLGAAGVLYYRLESGGNSASKKMVLVR